MVLASALALSACSGGPDPSARTDWTDAKIGFIFVGQRDDIGYNQAAWDGADAVAKTFPDHDILRREGVPETAAAEAAMEAMIKAGARLLFATSYGYLRYAVEVAKRHPDVVVLHQGGLRTEPLPNLGTYWGTVYEPVYQAGVVAGASTRTGKIGYVVAFPIPATFANVNAFTLGARTTNAKVTTTVRFTSAWCDPAKQAQVTADLLARGVDVLAQHQDCTGTVLRAAERAGVRAVGYHSDGSEVAPNAWLVGAVWNWRPMFVDITRTVLEGRFRGSRYNADYLGGYQTGDNPFVLTELGQGIGADVALKVRAADERFRAGGSPFEGPVTDRDGRQRVPPGTSPTVDEVESMDYFVAGVEGDLPAR